MVKCEINHWIDALLVDHFKNKLEFRNRMMMSRAIIYYRNSAKYFFPPKTVYRLQYPFLVMPAAHGLQRRYEKSHGSLND